MNSSRRGTYAIRFFPEAVREQADFLVDTWPEGLRNGEGPAEAEPLLSPVRQLCSEAPCSMQVRTDIAREFREFFTRRISRIALLLKSLWWIDLSLLNTRGDPRFQLVGQSRRGASA